MLYCLSCTRKLFIFFLCLCFVFFISIPQQVFSQMIATTTMTLSICGNEIVDDGEECDVLGETGVYSTTIAGRQCSANCEFGPYCGDAILQTIYGEECDDGNNEDNDFCSSSCIIEPAGSGGGGTSGGGSSNSGGSNVDFGDTQINVDGRAYPGERLHIILDANEVGTVNVGSDGKFDFATEASPGTVSMGFWSLDSTGVRSITLNTTFDVTQGAITNLSGILLPPTLVADDVTVNPGDVITFSGQSSPNATVELHINESIDVQTATSDALGRWSILYDTSSLSPAEYTARARFVLGSGQLTTESTFSTTLQLFVGVDGSPTRPSDLNRDGSVDLIDFSILIFWWGTAGGQSDPPADINGNGNVGLEDFSILLFNWDG